MKKAAIFIFFAISLVILFLFAKYWSPKPAEKTPLRIAVSRTDTSEHYKEYANWLKSLDSTLIIENLYGLPVDSALAVLSKCSGIIFSGGPDLHPNWYNRPEDTVLCGHIDLYRDTLEFKLIEKALAEHKPVLGICRGLQLINTHLGGELIADIPNFNFSPIHRNSENTANHKIDLDPNSELYRFTQQNESKVNSNHHQAIFKLGDKLKINAFANDSIAEGVEWEKSTQKPWLLAVQWHPERLKNNEYMSRYIGLKFLDEAMKHKYHKD